jgi:hypothetical protein
MEKFYIWVFSKCWDGERGDLVKTTNSLDEAKKFVEVIKDKSFGYNVVSKGISVLRREPQ